jgi:hypothetical protein
MNPMIISALLSMAPGLLSSIFGGDPQKKLRQQLQQLLGPQHMAMLQNQFQQQAMASPAYSQAQGQIAAGANATQGQLASSLGARGIGTSGTGAVLSSLTPSIVGSQQAGLNTAVSQMAGQQARGTIQDQIAALQGTSGPSQTRQMFGAGLDFLGPLLQQWLSSKIPGAKAAGGGPSAPSSAGWGSTTPHWGQALS